MMAAEISVTLDDIRLRDVPDRPGSIAELAAIAAAEQANILDIYHGRTFTSAQAHAARGVMPQLKCTW